MAVYDWQSSRIFGSPEKSDGQESIVEWPEQDLQMKWLSILIFFY